MTDPYSDERTGVLLNKPGIRDKAKLAAFERMVTCWPHWRPSGCDSPQETCPTP